MSLFDPVRLGELEIRNRIMMSPMSQRAAGEDACATDWHLVHYGSRAVGGCGLVMIEDTAVQAQGRTSHTALGLYEDKQLTALERIVAFCHAQGAAVGLQLAHAGRKAFADTRSGADTGGEGNAGDARGVVGPDGPGGAETADGSSGADGSGGAETADGSSGADGADGSGGAEGADHDDARDGDAAIAPSPIAFGTGWRAPREASQAELARVVRAFAEAARLAWSAGFDVIEIHAAHGYLLHQFLSPLTNFRADAYGRDATGRRRLLLETVEAVRRECPAGVPLFVRLPAGDGQPGGLDIEEMAECAELCADVGADLIDITGGTPVLEGSRAASKEVFGLAAALVQRRRLPMAVGGGIADGLAAERLVREHGASLVSVGRPLLANPYWPLRAAEDLRVMPPLPATYAPALGAGT
jgi:2,4-dienoyl-CoA reductase-like NADH-dependent reductase (Old Yellow Enzyme family)